MRGLAAFSSDTKTEKRANGSVFKRANGSARNSKPLAQTRKSADPPNHVVHQSLAPLSTHKDAHA